MYIFPGRATSLNVSSLYNSLLLLVPSIHSSEWMNDIIIQCNSYFSVQAKEAIIWERLFLG